MYLLLTKVNIVISIPRDWALSIKRNSWLFYGRVEKTIWLVFKTYVYVWESNISSRYYVEARNLLVSLGIIPTYLIDCKNNMPISSHII